MEIVDEKIPVPPREITKPFLMLIEQTYTIAGKVFLFKK